MHLRHRRFAPAFAALGAAVLLVSPGVAPATLYLHDAIPLSSQETGGYSVASLYNQNPTAASIVGGTGVWGFSSTGTQFARSGGLAYPAGSPLTGSGGHLATSNSSPSETAGRYLSRAIAGVPTSGTLYASVVIELGSLSTVSAWGSTQQLGAGFRRASSSPTNAQMPTDGVFFGFKKSSAGAALVVRIGGTDVTLRDGISAGTPYHCMAKVQIGVGTDGKEIVSTIVNPSMPAEPAIWDDTREVEFLGSGQTLAYYGVGGTYATSNQDVRYDEFSLSSRFFSEAFGVAPVATFDDGATGLAVDGPDEVAVSNRLSFVDGSRGLYVCYGTTDGGAVTSNWDFTELVADPVAVDTQYTQTLDAANLAADTLYHCSFVVDNGDESQAYALGVFLNGEVQATWSADAQEEGLVPGTVTVSRASATSATHAALTVHYTVGGTAVAGTDYVDDLSGEVTIPTGASSATVTVNPLVNAASASNTTVAITLAPGAYLVAAQDSATVTIQNWEPPAEYNVWIAPTAGNASDAANWSQGVPQADDDIMLGIFSSANMVWDAGVNGLPAQVASWTQSQYYAGTVTFPIQYTNVVGATFTGFAVGGDVAVEGGTWTHPVTSSGTPTHRLALSVGGDFVLGSNAVIDVSQKGYAVGAVHPGSAKGVHGGACGDLTKVYDSPYQPLYPGCGGDTHAGGGAVWIECDGTVVLDGAVLANSVQSSDAWNSVKSGAGGSVYLKGEAITGSGSIAAKSSPISRNAAAAGGRIALETTVATSIGLPVANVSAVGSSGIYGGSGGTVVTKTAGQAHGILRVANVGRNATYGISFPSHSVTTPVGGNWTFDGLAFAGHGILSVPAGTKLTLPNGFGSIAGVNKTSGLLYYGGEIDAQGASPYTFRSNWVFQAGMPYVVTGNVQVVDNGAIGQLLLHNRNIASFPTCDFTVVGDMTVDATSWLYARQTGFQHTALPTGQRTAHGGQHASLSGNYAYGSALNPTMPGTEGHESDSATLYPGGGVIRLNISGTLELNGKAEASGWYDSGCDIPGTDNNKTWSSRPGSGGTINITAGKLIGTGSIRAPAQSGNYTSGGTSPRGSTGGGRVAVRLTDPEATFSAHWLDNISAKGASSALAKTASVGYFASAGTVYLQTPGDGGEGHGTLLVRDYDNPIATNVVTWLPAASYADAVEDFRRVTLSILDHAHVKLSANGLRMVAANLESGSTLDLNGQAYVVDALTLGNLRVPTGTYTAADLAAQVAPGYVLDSAGNGTVEVTGIGPATCVIVR